MKDWFSKLDPKWLLNQGVGWTFLAIAGWWVATTIIRPTFDDHRELVKKVAATQEDLVKIQGSQSPKIDRIDRNTSN